MFAFPIIPGIAIAAMLGMMIFWKDAPKWAAYLSAAPAVVLNLFIPLYQMFRYYKASYQINKIEASRNKLPIDPIILVVLATMSPLVASIIVQEKLNTMG